MSDSEAAPHVADANNSLRKYKIAAGALESLESAKSVKGPLMVGVHPYDTDHKVLPENTGA